MLAVQSGTRVFCCEYRLAPENRYPASRSNRWSNVFRVSATLKDDVDLEVLRSALDVTVRRFPSIAVRLRKGVFWYYLEQLSSAPEIREDSFLKYSGKLCASRRENTAWRMTGTPEPGGFLNVTCFKIPVKPALEKAHEYNVTLSTFLGAAIMQAMQNSQKEKVHNPNRRKPIKLLIPVNLRKLFPSKTLRNFVLYTIPEILPKLGEYSFEEICDVIKSKLNTDVTPKRMSMMIAANVSSERLMAVRIMPLFVKNFVMKAVFKSVGERKSCLSMSNLGAVRLPKTMAPYVERFDFVLGVQASAPYNCGVISFGDTMYVNFIRNICEADLEYHFHQVLQGMGITAEVESKYTCYISIGW